MILETGWMERQMRIAAEQTANWPDWMKQEAGIYQHDKQPSHSAPHDAAEAKTKQDQQSKQT